MKRLASVLIGALALSAAAQHNSISFDRTGLERLEIKGSKCTGFFNTPSFKCERIQIPVYLKRAQDTRALIVVSHGSQGLDKRHSDYAAQLAANSINAVVVGHWEARGLGKIQDDYDKARRLGGDSPNMVLDVLSVMSYFKAQPQWTETKLGHIGESMGGTTAMNLTRPYLRRAFGELYGKQPPALSAIVSLYAGCTERNTQEAFLPYPLMFIHGADDDDALASDCQKQVPWMNGRGGKTEITVFPGEVHDFDSPTRWARFAVENPAKCANLRDGAKFTLEATGKDYPATTEGYAQMRRDCIRLSPRSVMSGNKGDPRTGYAEWTAFFKAKLLQ